jgi:hypothetical protein
VKRKSYRNQEMRDSASGEACVNCETQDGTVVLAHLPMMGIADGGSSKCDDFVSAYLCKRCHDLTDGERRRDVFWRYQVNMRTIRRMFEKGVIK